MGRQRRRPLKQRSSLVEKNDNESLWNNSINRTLRDGSFNLQMVGLGSPTATAFGRLVAQPNMNNNYCDGPISLGEVVGTILDEARTFHGASKVKSRTIPPVKDLFRMGSLWILSQQGDGNLPPQRCSAKDWSTIPDDWSCITLRLHYSPPRYPSCWSVSDAIVHKDKHFGFVILNKPGGVPAHATVDNGCENALSMFQAELASQTNNVPSSSDMETTADDGELGYASLPQRLDTETSGLMMIATKKEFSTYISKLLQQKTADHTQHDLNDVTTSLIRVTPGADIKKQYRCLVCLSNAEKWHELEKLWLEKTVVTHYLDFKSTAPKTFVSHAPIVLDSSSDQDSKSQWLQCKLRIARVGHAIPLLADPCCNEASIHLAQSLWRGEHSIKPASCRSVVELEVELLTGRTHQIRGQLKCLGCPIVGDPLYGGGGGDLGGGERMRSADSMALQCCAVEFPHPKWAVVTKKNGKDHNRPRLEPSKERCSVRLDRAWWTQYVDQYFNAIEVNRRKVTAGFL